MLDESLAANEILSYQPLIAMYRLIQWLISRERKNSLNSVQKSAEHPKNFTYPESRWKPTNHNSQTQLKLRSQSHFSETRLVIWLLNNNNSSYNDFRSGCWNITHYHWLKSSQDITGTIRLHD